MAEIYKNPAEYAAALTKRNKAGQQQPYVPPGHGDESGEYRDNAYGGGVDEEVIDDNDKVEVQPKEQENNDIQPSNESNDNISVSGDESSKSSSFESYVNENHKDTDFGKDLIRNYNLGNDDSKMLVDTMCNLSGVRVTKTNGIANYSGTVNLAIGDIRERDVNYSCHADGGVFYHEFHHCFDERLAHNIVDPKTGEVLFEGLVTDEDRTHVLQGQQEKTSLSGISFVTTHQLTWNLSTGKVLSNGKTLYETIQAECKDMSKKGIWQQLMDDYKEETEGQVLAKYPDWKEKTSQYNQLREQFRDEARKLYPVNWEDPNYNEQFRKRDEYLKQKIEEQLPNYDNYIKEVRNYRSGLERDAIKSWISISDMYGIYKKIPHGFCGGHAGNYSKRLPGAIALEFLAEYGSARSRNDKFAEKEIAIMQKYMPESSKMCDELRDLMIKAVKERK